MSKVVVFDINRKRKSLRPEPIEQEKFVIDLRQFGVDTLADFVVCGSRHDQDVFIAQTDTMGLVTAIDNCITTLKATAMPEAEQLIIRAEIHRLIEKLKTCAIDFGMWEWR